jgi:hypothetical protein
MASRKNEGAEMDIYQPAEKADTGERKNTIRKWPELNNILSLISSRITSSQLNKVMYGKKAIIRFNNNYGVEIFKHPGSDFYELTVIKFHGLSYYEFAFDIPIPDLNLCNTYEDILQLCEQVSMFK